VFFDDVALCLEQFLLARLSSLTYLPPDSPVLRLILIAWQQHAINLEFAMFTSGEDAKCSDERRSNPSFFESYFFVNPKVGFAETY
jgi:hypothetical protein